MNISKLDAALKQSSEWDCVLTAVEMMDRGQYGTLDIDKQNRILAFREKATNDGGWVNGGCYLMRESVIDMIPSGPSSIEKDIFPQLAAENKLGAVSTKGPLLDIGTPEGLEKTTAYLKQSTDH